MKFTSYINNLHPIPNTQKFYRTIGHLLTSGRFSLSLPFRLHGITVSCLGARRRVRMPVSRDRSLSSNVPLYAECASACLVRKARCNGGTKKRIY